jgi:hypothetical protein
MLLALLGFLGLGHAAAEGPEAELDRNRIVEGETITFTLTVPGDVDGEPDFTPLEQDFDILDRAQSSHTSIVNGRMSSQRVWRLVLAPKSNGLLTVPPIPVGRLQSLPQGLKVLPAGSKDAGTQSPPVFIEVEVTPESAFIQSQLVYTVRILHRVKLREGSLSDPDVQGALLERLGEDKSYRAFRNGHNYNVIERRYAVFPQQSGRLVIEGPVLSASVAVKSQRRHDLSQRFFGRDPFTDFPDIGGFFQETQPMRVRGKRLEVDVRPTPAGISGIWLPAQALTLEESWTPEAGEFRVGEPVTRTLTLKARGLSAVQLPDLEIPSVDGLKIYPDQPQAEQEVVEGGLQAAKRFKAALVPARPGRFDLPEIRVHWWNTNSDEAQSAVIPSRSIEVLPAAADATGAPASAAPLPSAPQAQSAPTSGAPLPPPTAAHGTTAGYWPWAAALLTAAWLLTLALWLRERRLSGVRTRAKTQRQTPPAASPRDIERACRKGEPRAARQALLAWAAVRWPQRRPTGLEDLAQRLASEPASQVLRELDRSLYSAEYSKSWDGTAAWKVLQPVLKTKPNVELRAKYAGLPELYPSTR